MHLVCNEINLSILIYFPLWSYYHALTHPCFFDVFLYIPLVATWLQPVNIVCFVLEPIKLAKPT